MTAAARACLAGVVLALASAGGAEAATFCVNKPSCVSAGGTNAGGDLQVALNTAAANAGADRVEIGIGAYLRSGGFTYAHADTVEIVGSGASPDFGGHGTVLLNTASNPTSQATLTLSGNPASSVANLRLQIASGTGISNSGLALHDGSASGVAVADAPPSTVPVGFELFNGRIASSSAELDGGSGTGAVTRAGGSNSISDSLLDAQQGGVVAAVGTGVDIDRTRLRGDAFGLQIPGGVNASISSSTITRRAQVPYVGPSGIAFVGLSGGDSTLTADHLSVSSRDVLSGESAVRMRTATGRTDTLILRNSVLSGFGTGIQRSVSGDGSGRANVDTDYSAYGPLEDVGSPNGTVTESNKLSVAPGFADPLRDDLYPRPDSPLIDAGDPAFAGDATDVTGQPRTVDGLGTCTSRTDIGAFELQPGRACTPSAGPGPAAPAPAGSSTTTTTTTTNLVFAGLSFSARPATEKKGVVKVLLTCPADSAVRCAGTLTLTRGRTTLGSKRFSIPAGKRANVSVRLNRAALRLLRRRRSLKALANVRASDASGAERQSRSDVTLKAAKKR